MADLYLTPAERYTAALGGFYYGDLPEPGTVYTQLIKDILDGATPDKEPKNILARFIYSLYISDLGDPYPRYELAKLLYWKLHDITPTKSGSILTVTIDGKEDYMTINTDLSRLWYKVLFGSKTDVITEFPYIFNTMQNKLSDWELFGNVSVSGTPTPDSPIMPESTGERTGNLFDNFDIIGQVPSVSNGNLVNSALGGTTSFIKMGSAEIVLSYNAIANIYLFLYDNDSQFIGYKQKTNGEPIYSTSISGYSNAVYCRVRVDNLADFSNANLMFNTGSTPLPYENFGYKIPISSANTTTPVYLGEVESTRRVKKLVLTGEEVISGDSAYSRFLFTIPDMRSEGVRLTKLFCTHYQNISDGRPIANVPNNSIYTGGGADSQKVFIKTTDYTTAADFKSYLAAQYAAGTPVTVWYVLAEPETGIVNEPLMRIGDYTDSLSMAKTGIDIPTVVGQNTLDVLTTVKPSSMRIEYTSAEETKSRSKRISLLKSPLKKGLIK